MPERSPSDDEPADGPDQLEDETFPTDVGALARELVQIPSPNPPGDERAVAEYVVDWARAHDLDAELVPTPEYPDRPNAVVAVGDSGAAADLSARSDDSQSEERAPTLVLNGHTDVVPAGDAANWTHDPYAGEIVTDGEETDGGDSDADGGDSDAESEGFLYGRGSADMKTGLAVALVTARELAPRIDSGDLPGALVVHAAVGEETGVPGTRTCIDAGYGGDCAIVLEPTDFRVATSAKGVVTYRVTARGESTHASQPDAGTNAIDAARALFDRIDAYDDRLREREDALVGRAYATVTAIEAGTDANMAVVPDAATFLLDRRVLPGEAIADVDAEVETLLADAERDAGVHADVETVQYYESASIPADHALAELVRKCTGDRAPRAPWGMEAATDAREFVAADVPAVVWGPGELSEAHTVDERISLADAHDAADVLPTIAERILRGDLSGDLGD